MSSVSEYVERACAKWRSFQAAHPETAVAMGTFVFSICGEIMSRPAAEQVAAMTESPDYEDLLVLIKAHHTELGLDDTKPIDIARWIQAVCFQQITATE